MITLNQVIEQLIYGIMTGGMYAMIGAGLSMIFGVMRLSNFAHGEFYMLGAYITYMLVLFSGIDPYIIAPLGAIIIGFLGIVINRTLINPLYKEVSKARGTAAFYFKDLNFILMTVGLSIFLVDLALIIWTPTPIRVNSVLTNVIISFLGVRFGMKRLLSFIIAIISLILLYVFLKKSKIGKAIRATSQNPTSAMLAGINVYKIYDIVMFISLALAALAGGLLGPIFNLYPRMGLDVVITAFVVVILGGMGNVVGSIYAGFILALVENYGGLLLGTEWRETVGFVIMMLILWLRPQGLMGGKKE